MNIGITCYPTFGGSGIVATNIGKQLAEKGHSIHFISSSLPYKLKHHHPSNIHFHEVEQVNYPLFIDHSPYVLLLASKMAEIAEAANLEIIHVHYAIPHAISAILCKQMLKSNRLKIVTTLHGTDVTLIGSLASLKDITLFSIENSDGVTAVSDYLKSKSISVFKPNKEISVIPNFVDTVEFNPKIEKSPLIRKSIRNEKIIMHISNFRKVKRIGDMISVFKKITEQIPSRLILIGEGPESCVARKMAQEYGIMDKIEFLGPIYDVAPLIVHADLLLQTSDHESFGLTCLEAIACGVPVIGTSGSGIAEVIDDGLSGFLSIPGDIEKMATDALRILTDAKLHNSFAEYGIREAKRRYSAETIINQYENFYSNVLK